MSKITCFNNTKLEEVFNSNKVTEQFEENAAVNIIKAEYDTILAELNAIKEELGIPTEKSKIITSKIKFQKEESKIMFQIAGEKGASNIEQYQQSLNQAKKLDEEGVSINEIEKQTGWFKNEQGQWKYFSNEILNEFLDISQRRNETVDLKEILKKDSLLLKAYPELNNVKVEFYEGTKGSDFRGNATIDGTIAKVGETTMLFTRTDSLVGTDSKSTIGHEVAHLLQSVEGFARGGNPNAFVKIASMIVGGNEIDTEISLRNKINTFDTSKLNKDEKKIIEIVREVIKTNSTKLLIDNYFLLQGEIDARAVELALELKDKFGKTINFAYSDLIKELGRKESSDLVNEAINIYLDDIVLSKSPQKIDTIQKVVDRLKQTGLAENVYQLSAEEINAKLKELGVSEDIRKQVVAYHGSPYSFDRFSTEKMGTGEGAQAFGWGLYFTDLESIARNYAKVLSSKNSYFVDDVVGFKSELKDILNKYEFSKNFNLPSIDSNGVIDQITLDIFLEQFQQIEQTFSLDKKKLQDKDKNSKGILPQYLSEFNKMYDSIEKRVQEYNNFIKEIKEFEEDFDYTILGNKNLYKVSLHKGKTPSEYTWLEWDTQTAKVIKEKFSNIIKSENLKGEIHNIKLSDKYDVESFDGGKTWKVGDTTKIGTEEEFVATFKDKKKAEKEAYNLNFVESNITGKDLYESLAKQIGQREASIFLLKNGIDGIKYPAESISRGATSDTARGFNYVVFDENAITIEEQIQFQKALNNIGINLVTNGFIYDGEVFLNKDTITEETPIHEFSHLLNSWMKTNRPELYNRGINLAKAELIKEDSEIKDVIDYVKTTQPNLTGEALLEEIVAELTGRKGAELLESGKKSGIIDWLKEFWTEIKNMLGILEATPEQVANMTLGDFAKANVTQLLSGKIIEPSATFNNFNTYTEAVKNTPINDIIKIDIEGVNVAEITNNGDINDLIRQDILADQRELSPNGSIVYVTKGNSLAKKLVNAEIAREIVKGRVNEQGNIVAREKVELTEVSEDFNKNKKEFGEEAAITILASQIVVNNTPAFGNNRIIDYSIEIPNDNVLMVKLKNLLQELGVKTMSLETWAESYKKRTGELPNANALSDITNKVIAFANGEITQDALTEEVMHFVVEGLNQEEIQPLLEMIHKTDEWKQYAQQYTEIYKDDAVVRKEILVKVLKNYVQNQQEQSTLQGQSITRRLVELLDKFFAQIRGLFEPKHQTQLDNFKEEIYQKLMAEELYSEISPEQFDGNKMVMYQTGTSPLYNSLTKAVDTFKGLDKITGNNFQYQLNDLELKEFDNLNQLKSASGLATTIRNHIVHLDKRGKQKGFLSTEETLVYQTIEKELQPALGMVSAVLRQEDMGSNSSLQKRVLAEIEDTSTQVDRLINDLKKEKQDRFKELAEQAAREAGLTENMKDILIKEMETLDRDTNQFYALFGGLSHAQNPILNILATVMSGVNRESNLQFTRRQNELLNVANRLGFKDEEVAQILKKFKDEYYFLSPYDFSTLFLEEAKIKAEIYKGISGVEVAPEELAKIEEEFKIKLSQDQLKDYLYQTTEAIRKSGLYIDVLKKEERKKIEDLTEDFSPKTKNLLNQLSARKRKVFKRAQDNGGLSSEDNYELQQIMYDQQKLSSPYDENGDLFEGLALNDENDVDLAEGISKESLSDEVRTAYELNHYNQKRREEFADGETKAPMRFIEEVQKIREEQGIDKAIEFLKLNSRISYNSNFWNTFDKAGGIVEKLKDNDGAELAEEIARQRIKLKNILKQHRMYNNPSQINFEEMSGTAISDVKDIVTSLNVLYKEAKLMLPEEVEEYTESQSETIVNEAYKTQIEDLGLDTLDKRLDFIYQHVTSSDKESLQRSIVNYKRYKNGDITNLPKAFTKFDSKSEEENIREYAESKLLPYFKELKPQDLNMEEFVKNIANVSTAEEFNKLVEEANYISISPAYIWLDAETSDRLNPEYTKRREANEPLVNLEYKGGMLKNKKYQEYFGINNGVATKNEKEFALLQEVIKFQESTIDAAGMEGKHNKYQLPQFRRQSMARIAQVAGDFSAKNLKESIKDAITVREDDPILGQTIDGQDSKNFQRGALAVPRMGFRKLESSEEVTDEVLYSVMLMAKEAEKRKQRIGALLDIESIRTELQGKQYGDKSGESTTTYKMFDDFVRYNIYGQTETFKWETDFFGLSSRKHNLAPVIRQFQNWVRLVNLGFSVLTPMTSLLQGTTNFMVEKFVGDRIDKDAAKQARKKVPKLVTEATSEFLNIRAKGELSLMMQYFGLESPMERYMNSNYGRVLRGTAINKSAYFSHFMGDLPLTAQTITTVLFDFKNVKGELINYSEWRNRNRSMTEKEARAVWAKEEKTAYGYLETKNGQMEMNEKFFSEVKNAQERLNFLKNRIQTAKQEIDNQIPQDDKSAIQRHAIFSFFSLHRGFLISSLAKRTKSRHLNLYTGQQEEGTYLGVFNFLGGMIKDSRKKGIKQAWLEQFKEYDGGYKKINKNGKFYILKVDGEKETEVGNYDSEYKRNEVYEDITSQSKRMRMISLKRGFSDVVVVNTLAFIALLLKNVADDDEDDYGKQFLAYNVYRLATEVAGQSVGLPAQVYQFLESPTVGLSAIQNSIDVFDLANDEQVKSGSYAGYSKRQAWIFKSLPLMKEYNKVINIDRTRNSYTHFNSIYLENYTFAGAMMDDKK